MYQFDIPRRVQVSKAARNLFPASISVQFCTVLYGTRTHYLSNIYTFYMTAHVLDIHNYDTLIRHGLYIHVGGHLHKWKQNIYHDRKLVYQIFSIFTMLN